MTSLIPCPHNRAMFCPDCVREEYAKELIKKIEYFTVYYRSRFSQDCSRNETKDEKNTEMIKLSDIQDVLSERLKKELNVP